MWQGGKVLDSPVLMMLINLWGSGIEDLENLKNTVDSLPRKYVHPQNWNDSKDVRGPHPHSWNWSVNSWLKLLVDSLLKSTKLYYEEGKWKWCVSTHKVGRILLLDPRISVFYACVRRRSMPLSSHVFFYFQIVNFWQQEWTVGNFICSRLDHRDMLHTHYDFISYFLFRKPSENSFWWSRAPCCNVNTFPMA